MGKHGTEYRRVEPDHYPTLDPWVVDALAENVELRNKTAWECACGAGHMSASLARHGCSVFLSDIVARLDLGIPPDQLIDFLSAQEPNGDPWGVLPYDLIATNPPFGDDGRLAEAFIAAGLRRLNTRCTTLALLFPKDFDSAQCRRPYFADEPRHAMTIALTRRPKWFERADGKRPAPRENSVWHVWRHSDRGDPVIRYAL
jgi:hypothetical protein